MNKWLIIGVVLSLVLGLVNTCLLVQWCKIAHNTATVVDLAQLMHEEVVAGAQLHLDPAQRMERASAFDQSLKRIFWQMQTDNPHGVVLVSAAVLSGAEDRTDWVRQQLRISHIGMRDAP